MMKQIEEMRKMKTTQQVLNIVEFCQEIKKAEGYKNAIGLNGDCRTYEILETIGLRIAVRKANSREELEACAIAIEENYFGAFDPQEWAEQVRIKAYGME